MFSHRLSFSFLRPPTCAFLHSEHTSCCGSFTGNVLSTRHETPLCFFPLDSWIHSLKKPWISHLQYLEASPFANRESEVLPRVLPPREDSSTRVLLTIDDYAWSSLFRLDLKQQETLHQKAVYGDPPPKTTGFLVPYLGHVSRQQHRDPPQHWLWLVIIPRWFLGYRFMAPSEEGALVPSVLI